jgi:hypothetical protein
LAANEPLTRSAFFDAPLILPDGIFPLPVARDDLKKQRKARIEATEAAANARRKRLAQLAADLASYQQAKDELLSTFEQTGAQPATNPTRRRTAAGVRANAPAGFLLSDAAVNSLIDSTKATLRKVGVAARQIDVAKSVTLLEK